jgi:hypothetical protein
MLSMSCDARLSVWYIVVSFVAGARSAGKIEDDEDDGFPTVVWDELERTD